MEERQMCDMSIPVNQLDFAGEKIPGYWLITPGAHAELLDGPLLMVVGSRDMRRQQPGVTYNVFFKARMKAGVDTATVNLRLEPGSQQKKAQINPSDTFQSLLVGTCNASSGVVRVFLYNMELNAIRAGLIIKEVTIERA